MWKAFAVFALLNVVGLIPPLSAQHADSGFVTKSRSSDVWTANSTSGKVKIDLREIRVEARSPYGKPVTERIVVFFEPESRAFSWYVVGDDSAATDASRQTQALKRERASFFKDGSLVIFIGGISPKLDIRDFRGNAISMDDAEAQAFKAAAELHHPPAMQDEGKLWHSVMLKRALGTNFVLSPDSEGGELLPKVTRVEWDGDTNHWIVTLKARWTAEITLDSNYKLLQTKTVK